MVGKGRRIMWTPPASLKFGSLARLLESIPALNERMNRPIICRMNGQRWIEALPIAVFAAILLDHNSRCCRSGNMLELPPKYGFLQRMNFFKVLGLNLREGFKRRDETGRFLPVQRVSQSAQVQDVAANIVKTLRVDNEEAALVLRHCVGEIVDNVFVHAKSPCDAVVCAQHFPNAQRTQVGIVDRGIGFRTSFEESPYFTSQSISDRDAIVLGIAPYVTSKPYTTEVYGSSYGRLGIGLFIVSEILCAVGGRVLIASGTALMDRGPRGIRWRTVKQWDGAIVGFEIPDSPLISYEAALRNARQLANAQRQQ